MYRFIESIKLKDGLFYRLNYHQKRVDLAFQELFPNEIPLQLEKILQEYDYPQEGFFKCRIVFDSQIKSVEFTPYTRREINSLKMVETDLEPKSYKLEDRTKINQVFSQRGDCDDVLMIRNGLVTDASYSNVAFYDGRNWFTPRVPVLYGTNRAYLIAENKIIEKDIKDSEMFEFKKICLFNAMIEFGELVLDIKSVLL